MSLFSWPSNVVEKIGTYMLENEAWMDSFLELSRKRLASCATLAKSELEKFGIPYAPGATAGFFLWLDARRFISPNSNKITWDDENTLTELMKKHKVYLTNGQIMTAEEPGFYRLCFARGPSEIRKGLERLNNCLMEMQSLSASQTTST